MGGLEDFRNWSDGWLRDGHFISYVRDGVHYFEHIAQRDLAHWVYPWHETITALHDSGPVVPPEFEITKGYDATTNTNHIWQVIFGIKGEVYIYIELPTDLHRHGIPKVPKPSSVKRDVSHFEEWMSAFNEPTFITEHFMMRPETPQVALSAYNPNNIDMTDVKLNFFLSKMVTERIGTVENGRQVPKADRWAETLDKLYRRLIPHRPITLLPVRMPAEAPAGE